MRGKMGGNGGISPNKPISFNAQNRENTIMQLFTRLYNRLTRGKSGDSIKICEKQQAIRLLEEIGKENNYTIDLPFKTDKGLWDYLRRSGLLGVK